MISTEALEVALGKLRMLRFFPANEHAVEGLAEILTGLCESDDELRQLTKAALAQWTDWPGPAALTQLYHDEVSLEPEFRPEWLDAQRKLKPEFADCRPFNEDEIREVAKRLGFAI